MKSKLNAVYNRIGRPSKRRLGILAGLVVAVLLVTAAFYGDTWIVSSLSLVMSLVTLGALIFIWNDNRKARAESRTYHERTEVTYRRILASIEVERLAAERRHVRAIVPSQEQNS